MKVMKIVDIEKAMGGKCIKGNKSDEISGVCIDSRKGQAGYLFFALPGEHNDGHEFLRAAKLSGCKGAVVSKETPDFPMENCILVKDTIKALQDLSKHYLDTFNIKRIAITGSTGKTTTKDMLAAVCGRKFETAKTLGNYNNHIGLPLTILSMAEKTELGIFEMGMDQLGEIEFLANLVRPDIAIITNVGYSHLEKLGTQENILKAKLEVTSYFNKSNTLIINGDGELLNGENVKGNYKVIKTGIREENDYQVRNIKENEEGIYFEMEIDKSIEKIQLSIPGKHNALNASLAIACGKELGISMKTGIMALEELKLNENRLGIFMKNKIKVIDDTYNASPDSVRGAIDVLISQKGLRKVAILGDMFELGEAAKEYHYDIGKYAGLMGVDLVVTVGDLAYNMGLGAKEFILENCVLSYEKREDLLKEIQSLLQPGDVVLVKGSRGMKLEEIVKQILD